MGEKRLILISGIFFVLFLSLSSSVFASVDVVPNVAYTNSDLTCNVDGGYVYEYRYEWRRDGVLYTGSLTNENIFPASLTTRGQSISCSVFTAANFFLGIDSVVIQNSAPAIISASPSSSSVTMSEGSSRTFSIIASDADSDVLTYTWRRDGVIVGSGGSFTFSPTQNGTYTIRVTVSDSSASTSRDWSVTVNDVNPSGIISGPSIINEGQSATFTAINLQDNPADRISSISWDFGDGTTGTGSSVSHSYSQQGSYTVRLTIRDEDSSYTTTMSVTVRDVNPVGNISGSDPRLINEGELATFTVDGLANGSAADTIRSVSWNFGDGNNATGEAVTHAYQDQGNYTVTLTITDEDSSVTDNITVNVLDVSPSFSLVANTTVADEGDYIHFEASDLVDSSADRVTSIVWNFGDGINGSGQEVDYRYTDNGSYEVTARVYDEDSYTEHTVMIAVHDVNPNANFTFSPSSPYEGQVISFDASSSSGSDVDLISGYRWNFGDGLSAVGPLARHVYVNNGTYTVTLTVSDEDSNSTFSYDIAVNNVAPSGHIAGPDPMNVNEGELVNFSVNGLSNGSEFDRIRSIAWDFGDGGRASGENVSHIYVDNGSYIATLTITDEDSSITDSVDVEVSDSNPFAGISIASPIIDEGETITFNADPIVDNEYDRISSITWDFGDGSTARGENVSHTYTDNGTYIVILRATDEDNFRDGRLAIVVNDVSPRIISFGFDPSSPVERQTINFSSNIVAGSSADPISSIIWDFGDGSTARGENVSHSYLSNGSYFVNLRAVDEDSVSSAGVAVAVSDTSPIANFTFFPVNPLPGQPVSFTDTSILGVDAPATYSWDFNNDGVVDSTARNPNYTYSSSGRYVISYTIRDSDGSSSTATRNITVGLLGLPPVVEILSPANNSNFSRFDPVLFSGDAADNIDGILPGSSLRWYSNLDGFLFNGNSFTRSNLSSGLHTITLSAVDSEGLVANASIIVNITGDSGRLLNTTLDGVYYLNQSTENIDSVNNSIVRDSTLTSPLAIINSEINSSTFSNVTANNSHVRNSILTRCVVINSFVKNIVASDCRFVDSYVDPSNLTGSTISGNSRIVNSNVTYSSVSSSNVTDSGVSNSNFTNSVVTNTTLNTVSLVNANISNGVIYSGNITSGGVTYNADANGSANLIDVIDFPPNAIFSVSPSNGDTSTLFTFSGSGSSDPNIPGLLNDSLTYSWNFGDGTTGSGVNFVKSYSNAGNYTTILTVSDRFGFTSTYSRSVAVSAPQSSSSSSGGSSGAGGGGSGGSSSSNDLINLGALNSTPKIVNYVNSGDTLSFRVNNLDYRLKVISISSTQLRVKLLETGQTFTVNLNDEFNLDLTSNARLFIKYLAYIDPSSRVSLRALLLQNNTQQNSQHSISSSSGTSIGNVVVHNNTGNNTSGQTGITGSAVADVHKNKIWIGLLIALVIIVLGFGLYLGIILIVNR